MDHKSTKTQHHHITIIQLHLFDTTIKQSQFSIPFRYLNDFDMKTASMIKTKQQQ